MTDSADTYTCECGEVQSLGTTKTEMYQHQIDRADVHYPTFPICGALLPASPETRGCYGPWCHTPPGPYSDGRCKRHTTTPAPRPMAHDRRRPKNKNTIPIADLWRDLMTGGSAAV